jgi:hypothetical protein
VCVKAGAMVAQMGLVAAWLRVGGMEESVAEWMAFQLGREISGWWALSWVEWLAGRWAVSSVGNSVERMAT